MITIYGKYTNAVVYTTENEQYAMDEYARRQLQMICDHPSAAGSKIRVMPDRQSQIIYQENDDGTRKEIGRRMRKERYSERISKKT